MKYCLFTLLLTLPALALGNPDQQEEYEISGSTDLGTEQNDTEETSITWVDDSHAYATDRAQALSEWMDSFFGDPVYDIEKPESLVRLEWANKWDEQEDDKSRVRVRGKLTCPIGSCRCCPSA